MRVLVTGSNGLLGRKLVDLLRGINGVELLSADRKLLDVTIPEQLQSVTKKFNPDVIINAAAMTQVDECELNKEKCWKQNVSSVQNLIEVCQTEDIHLVHVSTDFVFDGEDRAT
ncbi:MAG: sugar nucleotide-binding protein [Bacteroidota bacterium]